MGEKGTSHSFILMADSFGGPIGYAFIDRVRSGLIVLFSAPISVIL